MFEALQAKFADFPFAILGLDSENGGEFINHHLAAYCIQHGRTFTRSRALRKNENCYVEQKNWAVVRRTVGYRRYDTLEQVAMLNELYGHLRLYTNFFQRTQKLVRKERHGAKVRRIYDSPQTPCRRVLASSEVPQSAKDQMASFYPTLNPAALQREINRLQLALLQITPQQPLASTPTPRRGRAFQIHSFK